MRSPDRTRVGRPAPVAAPGVSAAPVATRNDDADIVKQLQDVLAAIGRARTRTLSGQPH